MEQSSYNIEDNGKNVVYTSDKIVSEMLSCVKDEIDRIDARVLEPACGNGNFLDAILRHKLDSVVRKYSHSRLDFEFYIIRAVMSIYGVEIDYSTVMECKIRLLQTTNEFYCGYFTKKHWAKLSKIIEYILDANILCGDALSLTNPQTGAPIVFAEWTFLGSFKVKRRDFIYDQLMNPSENAEHVVSDLNKANYIPLPVKEYPITKIFNIEEAYAQI